MPHNPEHAQGEVITQEAGFTGTREEARSFWLEGKGSVAELEAAMRVWRPHPNDLLQAYQARREQGLDQFGKGLIADLDFNYQNALRRSVGGSIGRGLGNTTFALNQDRRVDSAYNRDRLAIMDQIFQARQGVLGAGQNVAGTLLQSRAASAGQSAGRQSALLGAVGQLGGVALSAAFSPAAPAILGATAGLQKSKLLTSQFTNNTRTPLRNSFQQF